MVVLETAAITAAGYGLYKGGEAGIRKGKECHREFQREQQRSVHQNELGQKTKARSERISQIMSQRRGSHNTSNTSGVVPESNSYREGGATNIADTSRPGGNDHVKDRHKAVMAKLRQSRREEAKKSGNSGGLFKNPFKKK
jgi:hypothetical protein